MARAKFNWQSEDGVSIATGVARLWLVEVKLRPPQWALYEGFTYLGMIPRTDDDQTTWGEARLWMSIAALLEARGRKVDDWTLASPDDRS
jgi:hypothetical protein